MDIEALKAAGIDWDGGVKRFAENNSLYESCLTKFVSDSTFLQLQDAMAKQDYQAAFAGAHTLKGVTGNLSMTRLYQQFCLLADALRNNQNIPQAIFLASELTSSYYSVIAAIKEQTNHG